MPRYSQKIADMLKGLPVSGTYATPQSSSRVFVSLAFETIRLDVDGTFAQMMASGTYERARYLYSAKPAYWIAYPLKQTSQECGQVL